MRTTTLAGTLMGALLLATALTPLRAADMTFERALNVDKEPQNWLLHHGNFQGHRFSALKEINTDTVKNLKVAFTVALGGFEGGGTRYKHGNLEATPLSTRRGPATSPAAGSTIAAWRCGRTRSSRSRSTAGSLP